MTKPVLSVAHLKKSFGEFLAVNDISFELNKGEIVGYLGPNGAGKSTTIQSLMGFLKPTNGDIFYDGNNMSATRLSALKEIGYLAGDVTLNPQWTGNDHIELIKKIRNDSGSADRLVKLFDFDRSKKVKTLSTGNRQKLGIILALMHDPHLLILDEPTTGLDPVYQQHFYAEIKTRAEQGTAIFMSSHNLSEVENMCDRVLVLNKGEIIARESIAEIRSRKLYSVFVYFASDAPLKELEKAEIPVTRVVPHGVELSVKGNIKALIEKLQPFEYTDIQVIHSTLDKVFMEYYK